ncbi:hypothetical protein [Mycoplasmopsis sturni]|uniref:hypothetical protein n=1 Tax=Mycoplasmopsis sturni TaxID=39047 RepID=UPI00056A1ECE|nr:hypothetical protein [Mycoplasmopsis sturni]
MKKLRNKLLVVAPVVATILPVVAISAEEGAQNSTENDQTENKSAYQVAEEQYTSTLESLKYVEKKTKLDGSTAFLSTKQYDLLKKELEEVKKAENEEQKTAKLQELSDKTTKLAEAMKELASLTNVQFAAQLENSSYYVGLTKPLPEKEAQDEKEVSDDSKKSTGQQTDEIDSSTEEEKSPAVDETAKEETEAKPEDAQTQPAPAEEKQAEDQAEAEQPKQDEEQAQPVEEKETNKEQAYLDSIQTWKEDLKARRAILTEQLKADIEEAKVLKTDEEVLKVVEGFQKDYKTGVYDLLNILINGIDVTWHQTSGDKTVKQEAPAVSASAKKYYEKLKASITNPAELTDEQRDEILNLDKTVEKAKEYETKAKELLTANENLEKLQAKVKELVENPVLSSSDREQLQTQFNSIAPLAYGDDVNAAKEMLANNGSGVEAAEKTLEEFKTNLASLQAKATELKEYSDKIQQAENLTDAQKEVLASEVESVKAEASEDPQPKINFFKKVDELDKAMGLLREKYNNFSEKSTQLKNEKANELPENLVAYLGQSLTDAKSILDQTDKNKATMSDVQVEKVAYDVEGAVTNAEEYLSEAWKIRRDNANDPKPTYWEWLIVGGASLLLVVAGIAVALFKRKKK